MRLNSQLILNKRNLSWAILWLAVLTFNNWLLAAIFNRPLLTHDGSVSEFSVTGQPHAWLFRSLDIISGLLFLAVAALIYLYTRPTNLGAKLIILATLLLGLGNFSDALMPLACAQTLNSTCQTNINLSLSHLVLPDHAYSSIAVGLSYFLLPLGGFIYARQKQLKTFFYVSGLVLLIAVVSFLSVVGEYKIKNSFTVRTFGLTQEVQMIIISSWFVFWYWSWSKKRALNGR